MCGFSNMACRILDLHNVPYGSRDVLADPDLREGVKQFTHWPTIPQVGGATVRKGWGGLAVGPSEPGQPHRVDGGASTAA